MTIKQLQRINALAQLLERYSRFAERSDEGKEIFEKTIIETIEKLTLEIK